MKKQATSIKRFSSEEIARSYALNTNRHAKKLKWHVVLVFDEAENLTMTMELWEAKNRDLSYVHAY